MVQYRIVRDGYLGFEVQWRRWWAPFWRQCGLNGSITNSHASMADAREFMSRHMAMRGGHEEIERHGDLLPFVVGTGEDKS
jgi:hypothetical protein